MQQKTVPKKAHLKYWQWKFLKIACQKSYWLDHFWKKCTAKEKENLYYLTLVTKGNHTQCIITWILYLFISQNRDWEDEIFLFVNVKYNHSLREKKRNSVLTGTLEKQRWIKQSLFKDSQSGIKKTYK